MNFHVTSSVCVCFFLFFFGGGSSLAFASQQGGGVSCFNCSNKIIKKKILARFARSVFIN